MTRIIIIIIIGYECRNWRNPRTTSNIQLKNNVQYLAEVDERAKELQNQVIRFSREAASDAVIIVVFSVVIYWPIFYTGQSPSRTTVMA